MLRRSLLLSLLFPIALAAEDGKNLAILVKLLSNDKLGADAQARILSGMKQSLQGQRGVPEPVGWAEVHARLKDSPNEEVRSHLQALSVIFGATGAMDGMRKTLADSAAPVEARRKALEALVAQQDTGSVDALLALAREPGALREPALRGLAGFDDARIATTLTELYPKLDTVERRSAVQTLLARSSGAKAFLAAIDSGAIPKAELNAPLVRQIQGFKDQAFDAWLTKNWGAVKESSADKKALIEKYKEFLHPDVLLRADANRGRALFGQTCAVCHSLFGTGGHIGPELTGGYEDVDYLLTNILDPNAVIGKDYQQTFVKTKGGQIMAGIVTQETESAISLKTLTGEVMNVQKSEVASTELSPMSMMPEGLLSALEEDQVRDLFLYLRQKKQVPMMLTEANANDFFNGVDLRNWTPSPTEGWKLEGGELVGRAKEGTAALSSETLAANYQMSLKVRTEDAAAVELVLSGTLDDKTFHGTTLSFGGHSAINLWDYRTGAAPQSVAGKKAIGGTSWHSIQVTRKNEMLRVVVDGEVQFEQTDNRHRRRVQPAFFLKNGSLRVKDIKIQPL